MRSAGAPPLESDRPPSNASVTVSCCGAPTPASTPHPPNARIASPTSVAAKSSTSTAGSVARPASTGTWWREPTITVGADQVWNVHYSRFMESALDFRPVPFVHGVYTPGVGQQLTDVRVVDEGRRISMSAKLTNPDSGRSLNVAGDVIMPCAVRVRIGSTQFVAVGAPVDDRRTWVAANDHPAYTAGVPGLRKIEAWLAMFVDCTLFQRQDRKIFEGLGSTPSRRG